MNRLLSAKRWQDRLAENRIYLLTLLVFALMAVVAPRFLTLDNQRTILQSMSVNAIVAIGFTLVLITGNLDLSIGTSLTVGGIITLGLEQTTGLALAILLACLAGSLVGLTNGLLVSRLKVHSFIASLGTMIVCQGIINKTCEDTITAQDPHRFAWLDMPIAWVLTPQTILAFALVGLCTGGLNRTVIGRQLFLVGASPRSAWFAGLSVRRYVIGSFVLSGTLACLAGAVMGMGTGGATPTMGNVSLMTVVAAVIVGGTSMTGGRGSVLGSAVALLMLAMLINGFNDLGADDEVLKITTGCVLALVILYEAAAMLRSQRTRGQRRELLDAIKTDGLPGGESTNDGETGGDLGMHRDKTLAVVATATVGCVAVVAIVAMFLIYWQSARVGSTSPVSGTVDGPAPGTADAPLDNLSRSLAVDTSQLRSMDGQLLVAPAPPKEIPPRPDDPSVFSEDDARHWYDMEYAGFGVDRASLLESPADGAGGKTVLCLNVVDHPYQTAYHRGMKAIADAYQIELVIRNANMDLNRQKSQVDQAINERPDMVIFNAVNAKACAPMLKKLNEAGIPVIASNLLIDNAGLQYCLSWTGPDDWGQMRMLARKFAELMDYEGGYCIVRHRRGNAPYFARAYGVVTELKKIAPEMKLLDMQTSDLQYGKTKELVTGWLARYGREFKGIVSADDSQTQIGINDALANASREDVIRVSAGNSKVGMDCIKKGTLRAITFQSPGADGAIPMQLAADWFDGKHVPEIRYLERAIITKENVDDYLPAQW